MRIATRGSPLALAQARRVAETLTGSLGVTFELLTFSTAGDRFQTGRPADFGGKGVFTREPEEALRAGIADLAVHSMKDMAADDPDDLCIAAVPVREDPRDVWVGSAAPEDLPAGARVGTASLRRRSQVLRRRPDLQVDILRGNVGTRLQKLADGVCEATVPAAAGLRRLGLDVGTPLDLDRHLPAACQGLLAVQMRGDSPHAAAVRAALNDADAETAGLAERAFLRGLGASCRMAVAAHAQPLLENRMRFRGEVYAPDGSETLAVDEVWPAAELITRALQAGRGLLDAGAGRYLCEG